MGADGSPCPWRPDLPRAGPAASGTAVRTRAQQQLPHLCCLARPRRADVPCPPPSHTRTVPAILAASPGAVLHWGLVLSPGKLGAVALCREQPRTGPVRLNWGPDSSTPALSTEHTALGRGFQKMKEALGRVSKHRAWRKEREELCCAAAWASSRLSARARLHTPGLCLSRTPLRGTFGTPGTQHHCHSHARTGITS